MSSIDERIVQMQFENSQFEKGVKQSIKTLENLKESLKLEEAADGLKKLQEAGDSFSLSKIADGVDNLSERFSVFGTFAGRIIENLADSVYNKLGNALKTVTIGQVGGGWEKYAEDTTAVQSIWFATKDYDPAIKGIEDIEAELDKLMWFTDETSYNYTDMVSNIGKFTAMKIPLEDARVAMQGIALATSAAGQGAPEASRAMYNLSQAMGMGALKLQDWNSLVNANIVTAQLSEKFIEAGKALGTLNEQGEVYISKKNKMKVTAENIRDSLSAGWITKDVMMKVFRDYGEFAEVVQEYQEQWAEDHDGEYIATSKVIEKLSGTTAEFAENAFRAGQEAKTFDEAIASLSDAATTKWLKIFKLIFGNYEEVKKLWTELANDLYDVFVDPLNNVIEVFTSWHDLNDVGGWKDFIQGVFDIMEGLTGLLSEIRDAFSNMIPPITLEALKDFSIGVKEFGASFKAAFGRADSDGTEEITEQVENIANEVENATEKTEAFGKEAVTATSDATDHVSKLQEELKRGSRGKEVKRMQEQLIGLGYHLDRFGADGIWGPETQAAWEAFCADMGLGIDSVYDEATSQSLADAFDIAQTERQLSELGNSIKLGDKGDEVKKMQERLIALGFDLDKFGADGIWGPETQAAYEKFLAAYNLDPSQEYDQKTHNVMVDALKKKYGIEEAEEATEKVDELSKKTLEAEKNTADYTNRLEQVKSIFGGIFAVGGIALKIIGVIGKAFVKIVSLAKPLIGVALSIGAAVGDALISFNEWLGQEGRFESFFSSLDKALKPIGDWIQNIADSILIFFELKEPLSGTNEEILTFRKLWNSVVTAIKNSTALKLLKSSFESLKASFASFIGLFKDKKFSGKGIGKTLLKGLELLGKGILLLITPVAFAISKLAEFIAFLVGKLPDGISKLKDFWASLSLDDALNSKGIVGFLATAKKTLTSIKTFWFGGVDENGNKKDGVFSAIGKLISGDIQGFRKALAGNKFVKQVSDIINSLKPLVSKIGAGFVRLFTGSGGGAILSPKVIEAIDKFRSGIKSVFDHIRLLVSGNDLGKSVLTKTEKAVLRFRNWIITSVGNIKKFAISIWEAIKNFVTSINFGSWDDFKKSISDIWTNIKNAFTNFFSGLGNGLSNSISKFKETAGYLAIWGLAIASIILVISRIIKIVKTLYGAITDFSKFLSQSNKKEEQKLSEKILQFAASIALISGSIYLLTLVDPGVFWKAFARMTAILAVLGGFAFLAGKFGKGDAASAISTISDAVFKVTESLVILAGAIVALGFIKPETFWKGYKYLSAILAAIVVFSALMAVIGKIGKVDTSSNGIKSVAIAVLLLAEVVKLLSRMKFETFANGFIKLTALMALIITFMLLNRTLSYIGRKDNSFGLLSVAGILLVMSTLVALLSFIPFERFVDGIIKMTTLMGLLLAFMLAANFISLVGRNDTRKGLLLITGVLLGLTLIVGLLGVLPASVLIKGIVGMIAVMAAMTLFMLATSKVGSMGLKKVSVLIPIMLAIIGLVATFEILAKKLQKISFGAVAGALISLITIVGSLKKLFKVMAKNTVEPKNLAGLFVAAVALSGAMIAFAYAMSLMKDSDATEMLGFATSMSEIMIAFSLVARIAGMVGGGKAFLGIVGVAGGLAVAMAAFSAILSIPGVDGFLSGGAEKIGKIFGSLVGAMKAAEIDAFNRATSDLQSVESVDQDKVNNAVNAAQSVADFGSKLPEKGLIQQAADFIFGSELTQFSKDMSNFGIGFNSFATAINDVQNFGDLTDKTNSAIGIAESIEKFGNSLKDKPIDQTIVDGIFGSKLSQFSEDMSNFGTGFNGFATAINDVQNFGKLTVKTNSAIGIATSIKNFGDSLKDKPIDQTIVDGIFGSKLSQFSEDMTNFGTGFNGYADAISTITNLEDLSQKTTAAVGIATSIKNFGDSLKEKSIDQTIVDAIFQSPLKSFSGDMSAFGRGFNKYAETMGKINANLIQVKLKTTMAISISESIRDFANSLEDKTFDEKMSDKWFGSKFKGFSGDMSAFATEFNKYAETMGTLTANPINVVGNTGLAILVASQIATFLDSLKSLDIETKKTGLAGWFEGSDTKGETVITTIGKLAESMEQSAGSFEGLSSGTLADDVAAGIGALKAFAEFLTVMSSDEYDVSSTVEGSKELYSQDGKLGDYLKGLTQIANNVKTFAAETEGIDLAAVSSVVHSISEFMALVGSELSTKNLEDIESFDFGKALAQNIVQMTDKLLESNDDFKTAGANFDLGLTQGIVEYAESPANAAGDVAQAMLDKIAEVLDEHSPSVETMKQGVNFVLGLVNGVNSEGDTAESASEGLGNKLLNGLKDALGSEDFSLDSILSENGLNLDVDSIVSEYEGALDPSKLLDMFKSGDVEASAKDTFDTVSEYADTFKSNYSLDKLLQGDLKRGSRGEAVKAMQEQLMSLGYNLDKYGADGIFGPETQAAVNQFKKDMGLATDGIFDDAAAKKLADAINSESATASYLEAGKQVSESISGGMTEGDTSASEGVIATVLEKVEGFLPDFKTTGENFSIGLANGVTEQGSAAISAAKTVAQQMLTVIRNTFQVASPSKVTTQIGEYFSKGLSRGVANEGDSAVHSTEDVADKMLEAARGPLASLSELLMQDIDTEPTITPVIDLTGAQEAAGSIRDLFDNPRADMSITRNLAAKATLDGNGQRVQSRAELQSSSLEDLRKKLESVNESMANHGTKGITERMDTLADKFERFADAATHNKIVLDSGVLVGETTSAYNRQFGLVTALSGRGN